VGVTISRVCFGKVKSNASPEQRKRFLARIDEKDKNWKLSTADIAERGFWKQYMKAYEKCLSATSTREAPWYAFPPTTRRTHGS
jgi:polyphosphate kinase 2 (PPK2 family)